MITLVQLSWLKVLSYINHLSRNPTFARRVRPKSHLVHYPLYQHWLKVGAWIKVGENGRKILQGTRSFLSANSGKVFSKVTSLYLGVLGGVFSVEFSYSFGTRAYFCACILKHGVSQIGCCVNNQLLSIFWTHCVLFSCNSSSFLCWKDIGQSFTDNLLHILHFTLLRVLQTSITSCYSLVSRLKRESFSHEQTLKRKLIA